MTYKAIQYNKKGGFKNPTTEYIANDIASLKKIFKASYELNKIDKIEIFDNSDKKVLTGKPELSGKYYTVTWIKESIDEPLEIHYHDGKPEVKKKDLSKELNKELHKEEKPVNYFDAEKSALYANTPKAKQKMDKSINARAINSVLESYNKQRNEAKFDVQRNGHIIMIKADGYQFKCDDEQGTIITTKVPDKGLKMSLKASRLRGADIDVFFDEVEKHLERNKAYKRDNKGD